MESYPYSSSYPDSGDSSPRSREIECETAVAAWDEAPPAAAAAAAARVKLMCSYGGRIQPRSHDNQLSYVGGDTKILAVDRSIRCSSIIAKLAALSGYDEIILKYQLPGEDLDALISVTNDEDVEHMMLEYDRLHRIGSKPVARLRLFLFPATVKRGQDPPLSPKDGPDYLFGLEAASFVPPASEKLGIEVPPAVTVAEAEAARSPTEIHVQELQKLQIDENQPPPPLRIEETLARAYPPPPPDYYAPPVQEKAPPTPAAYWPEHHRSAAPAARFASFVGGDGNIYLIPASAGVFPAGAAPGPAYYVQRVVPAPAYDSQAPMYPPQQQAKAADGGAGYAAPPVGAYDNGAGYAAYDSAGRPVYYAGAGATYQTVSNVAIAAESKALKPPQVS